MSQQTEAQRFRKKPVVIDAYQLPAAGQDVPDSFHEWCERVGFDAFTSERDETLAIETLEGVMTAQPGDWIIKGVAGEFYPCKPEIFAATYEPADVPAEGAEPVAQVGPGFQLLWTGGGSFADHARRHGLKIGSNLYTHPATLSSDAQDAARLAPVAELLGHIADVLDDDAFGRIDVATWNTVSAMAGRAAMSKGGGA